MGEGGGEMASPTEWDVRELRQSFCRAATDGQQYFRQWRVFRGAHSSWWRVSTRYSRTLPVAHTPDKDGTLLSSSTQNRLAAPQNTALSGDRIVIQIAQLGAVSVSDILVYTEAGCLIIQLDKTSLILSSIK